MWFISKCGLYDFASVADGGRSVSAVISEMIMGVNLEIPVRAFEPISTSSACCTWAATSLTVQTGG